MEASVSMGMKDKVKTLLPRAGMRSKPRGPKAWHCLVHGADSELCGAAADETYTLIVPIIQAGVCPQKGIWWRGYGRESPCGVKARAPQGGKPKEGLRDG